MIHLWSSFQAKVNEWVLNHQGEIKPAQKEKKLPSLSWLNEALKKNDPITKIPCE